MPSEKYVIGTGSLLAWALACWAEVAPDEVLHPVDISEDSAYRFDLQPLADVSPSRATAFVAWGPQFLNFRRLELMGELKSRGFKLPPLICRSAIVSATASVGENCVVGAGAIIGAKCRIGFNASVGSAAVLGHAVAVGASTWIESGVHVGAEAVIGAHATLGQGVHIAPSIQVGKRCIVEAPGHYRSPIPDGTHYLCAFRTPVVILNG